MSYAPAAGVPAYLLYCSSSDYCRTGSYTVQGTEPDTIVYLDTSRVLDEVYSSLGLPALIVMVMLIYRQ